MTSMTYIDTDVASVSGNFSANVLYGDGSNLTGISASTGDKIYEGNTTVETIDTGSNGHITFNTEGTQRMILNKDGKLSFGDSNSLYTSETDTSFVSSYNGSSTTYDVPNTTAITIGEVFTLYAKYTIASDCNDHFGLIYSEGDYKLGIQIDASSSTKKFVPFWDSVSAHDVTFTNYINAFPTQMPTNQIKGNTYDVITEWDRSTNGTVTITVYFKDDSNTYSWSIVNGSTSGTGNHNHSQWVSSGNNSITFDSGDNLVLGRQDPASGNYFKGTIDKFQVYQRRLSSTERAALFDTTNLSVYGSTYITGTSNITTITDGNATLSGGSLSGLINVASTAATITNVSSTNINATKVIDGTATLSGGSLSGLINVASTAATITNISSTNINATKVIDGTATLSGGSLSGLINVASTAATITNVSVSTLTDGTGILSGGSITSLVYVDVDTASVSGNLSANALYGDGSNLTGITASSITNGIYTIGNQTITGEKTFDSRVIMSTITDNTMTINNGSITEILSMRKNYYESSSFTLRTNSITSYSDISNVWGNAGSDIFDNSGSTWGYLLNTTTFNPSNHTTTLTVGLNGYYQINNLSYSGVNGLEMYLIDSNGNNISMPTFEAYNSINIKITSSSSFTYSDFPGQPYIYEMLVYLTKRENFISFQDNSLSGLLDFSSSNGSISNSLYVSNINDGTATLSGGSITNLDLVKTSVASVTSNLSAGTVKATNIEGSLANCTSLPISTGVSGLGSNVATFLATPSSSNLISAVTDETGTGSLVFATSPTLVTPALGTPSSGVLTNCTGTANGLTAGAVNNGVYTTGDQTIAGNKTFSNIINTSILTDGTSTLSNGSLTNLTNITVNTISSSYPFHFRNQSRSTINNNDIIMNKNTLFIDGNGSGQDMSSSTNLSSNTNPLNSEHAKIMMRNPSLNDGGWIWGLYPSGHKFYLVKFGSMFGDSNNDKAIAFGPNSASVGNFTGKHITTSNISVDYTNNTEMESYYGKIVSSTGTLNTQFWVDSDITNNTNNLDNGVPVVELSNTKEDKKIFGVISKFHTNQMEINNGDNFTTTYNIGDDKYIEVNSVGDGKIMVSNINGNISNGDYICSSNISGIGERQTNDTLHNYTVAKALQDEDFSSNTTDVTYNNTVYKTKLIACTYHCG